MVGARRHTRWLLLLAVGTLLAAPARAGELIRLFGEENVGTAGAQFLRVPVGARAVAMGKSSVASALRVCHWDSRVPH